MTVPCPDPKAHRMPDKKLQEEASAAALLAASPSKQKHIIEKQDPLPAQGAAASLKQARAEDLPSYPSSGGITSQSSYNAAKLASKDHKDFELWQPDSSSAAEKAALSAKDIKSPPAWQPPSKSSESRPTSSSQASSNFQSAATIAFKKGSSGILNDNIESTNMKNKALLAAKQSIRLRSDSNSSSTSNNNSATYPDSANAAQNALSAATKANRSRSMSKKNEQNEEVLVDHKILSDKIAKEMWTENPPVSIEVEEKKHNDALRASAISFAKQMYDVQQSIEETKNRNSSLTQLDVKKEALAYINLQSAAKKLADERLAKLDPDGSMKYREHWGVTNNEPERRRLSLRNATLRKKSENNNDEMSESDDDDLRSRKIRLQMKQFNKDLEEVDEKNRKADRAALMVEAERRVQLQMKSMDEKVYADTGKVSPAMMEQWETKARAKAQSNSNVRTENYGKTDIGGGKFVDMKDVEIIAAARLKSTLDEINDNAEKRRARDEEMRIEQEEKKRLNVELKAEAKQNKLLEKNKKNVEKERKAEEKRLSKRKSLDVKSAGKQDTIERDPISSVTVLNPETNMNSSKDVGDISSTRAVKSVPFASSNQSYSMEITANQISTEKPSSNKISKLVQRITKRNKEDIASSVPSQKEVIVAGPIETHRAESSSNLWVKPTLVNSNTHDGVVDDSVSVADSSVLSSPTSSVKLRLEANNTNEDEDQFENAKSEIDSRPGTGLGNNHTSKIEEDDNNNNNAGVLASITAGIGKLFGSTSQENEDKEISVEKEVVPITNHHHDETTAEDDHELKKINSHRETRFQEEL